MEYKTKNIEHEMVNPGTAGIAQKISSKNILPAEVSGLFALRYNDITVCGQNQY